MKALTLSEDQKAKLLEMCEKLFPEWNFITFQETAIMGAGWDYDFNNMCFSKKSKTLFDIEINIHWFEFCNTHLSDKLIELDDSKVDYSEKLDYDFATILQSSWFESHPVDYLYNQFQKIFNKQDN